MASVKSLGRDHQSLTMHPSSLSPVTWRWASGLEEALVTLIQGWTGVDCTHQGVIGALLGGAEDQLT